MFKNIVYGAVMVAILAGARYAVQYEQSFQAAQMRTAQAFATPAALASPNFDANAAQARAGLQAVADDGMQWAAAQQP